MSEHETNAHQISPVLTSQMFNKSILQKPAMNENKGVIAETILKEDYSCTKFRISFIGNFSICVRMYIYSVQQHLYLY